MPLLLDLVVPIGAYYVLRGAGVGAVLALVLSSVPTTAFVLHQIVRRRTIDRLAMFVLAALAVSIPVSFVTGSPRFMLAKDGWITAAFGIVFLATSIVGKPLAFTLSRALLERIGLAMARWDEAWERSPRFRGTWHLVNGIWVVTLLLDSVVRLAMAYTLPVDSVPALSLAQWIVVLVLVQAVTNVYLARSGVFSLIGIGGRRRAARPGHLLS